MAWSSRTKSTRPGAATEARGRALYNLSRSVHLGAAVHQQGLPGHEVALRRAQEHDRAHQVLRHFGAFEGAGLEALLVHGGPGLVDLIGADRQPWGDSVHSDVILPHLSRQRPGEPDDARL